MRVMIGPLLIVLALPSAGCDSIFGIGDHEPAAGLVEVTTLPA